MVRHPSINNTDIGVAGHLWATAITRLKPNGEEVGRIGNVKSALSPAIWNGRYWEVKTRFSFEVSPR
jgi:hypothetical protein